MAFNDSLSDMLARIKNAHQANKVSTLCLKSKLNMNVLSVLKDEGYIRDFKNIEERKGIDSIQIDLKYYNGNPVIKKIKRVSKPGIRKYSKISELNKPYGGLGISILSTQRESCLIIRLRKIMLVVKFYVRYFNVKNCKKSY